MEDKNKEQSEEPEPEFVGPRERLTPLPAQTHKPVGPLADSGPTPDPEPTYDEPKPSGSEHKLRRWYFGHKKVSMPASLFLILLVLGALPFTRYAIAGSFLRQDVKIQVIDSKTGAPVSAATVKIGNLSSLTSGDGTAELSGIKVGKVSARVTKNYYKDGKLSATVPVLGSKKAFDIKLLATGRQVNVAVKNFVTGQPIGGADISVSDVKAKTDSEGSALIVLPAGPRNHPAEIKYDGYNSSKVIIVVKDTEIATNEFKLTPAGRIYYLSNAGGQLDVLKANLDGGDVKTVLAGTGSENPSNTTLLASPDWKYLALLARRDGSRAKLYVLSAGDDKLNTADEGSADFNLVGWSGDNLIYTAARTDLKPWQTGASKLKSYSAGTGKLTTLDQTTGSGNAEANEHEFYSFVNISGDEVIFAKGWTSQTPDTADYTGKEETLNSVKAGGQDKKKIAGYDAKVYAADYTAYKPGSIYILSSNREKNEDTYYDYQVGGTPKPISLTFDDFYKEHPIYYHSPEGKKAVWSELRDGKPALIIGEPDGSQGKQIASLEEGMSVLGWHSPSYILLSKNGSELYISGTSGSPPKKLAGISAENFWAIIP